MNREAWCAVVMGLRGVGHYGATELTEVCGWCVCVWQTSAGGVCGQL